MNIIKSSPFLRESLDTDILNGLNVLSVIDLCSTNPCDVNADCTVVSTSYSCSCRTGFSGPGTTCTGTFDGFKHRIVCDTYLINYTSIDVSVSFIDLERGGFGEIL